MSLTQKEYDEIIQELNRINSEDLLVLVEGKKDIRAMGNLGITNVVELKGPLFSVVEKISETEKKIVLLMDLDPEGRKLQAELKKGFSRFGVQLDEHLREMLFRNTDLRVIEGLDSHLDRFTRRQPAN